MLEETPTRLVTAAVVRRPITFAQSSTRLSCTPMNPRPYPCIHALNESDRTFEPQITAATRLPR